MDFVRAWWDWCSESFGHMFLGVTAPILLAAAAFVLLIAGGGDSFPQPPRSEVAGVCVGSSSSAQPAPCASAGVPTGLVIDTATPLPATATPAPRVYVVQAGDTLSVICAAELPELPADDCVQLVVERSGLDGPDAIFEGQQLQLPGAAMVSGTPAPRRTPAPTSTPGAPVFQPEPTATVEDPEPTPIGTIEPDPTATPEPAAGVLTPLLGTDESADDSEENADAEGEGQGEGNQDSPESEASGEDGALVPLLGDLAIGNPTLPHDFDMSNAHLYVVEPGESLLSICFDQYPDLPAVECVAIIVALNDLDGAGEIYAHQGILLP